MDRALLIDCDGVLVDVEIDGHLAAFNQVWREEGVPWQWTPGQYRTALRTAGGRERLAALAGSPDFLAAVGSLARFGDWRSTVERWHRRKTELLAAIIERGGVQARPGVVRLMREARQEGWALAVVSSGTARTVHGFVRTLLADLADDLVVVTGDDVSTKKPDPEGYLRALTRLRVPAHRALAVEDSHRGLRAAVTAGLTCLVTTTPATAGQDFTAAVAVLSDLGEPGSPPVRGLPGEWSGHVTVAHLASLLDAARSGPVVHR
ncbi:haloacid dehalogenase superfamily, subfamily IA, variant 3 with third motif having DD or ED [Lentzea fradiae]|uniref:Haloacid dehalogenase superfamily, subfamily IA, variant 3 with third motif having DD or ED n=1 Tax=Lentzea fradiae TaxID=200378 RepID=A0A1G8CSR8_9PSEU|nr:HAD-IA family hydrolase [Lentzea fradiae]SDH48587.1 haloacid dehalogenase superfamily, subfamily IA, variant 3 with third motif having DD or ED [Lentzea fradiae]